MFSYWEKKSLFHFDIIVIGSGITGLSTALSILEKNPQLKVAVLERGIIPAGASTRNAGFACIGSFTEILDDLEHMSEARVLSLVKMRRDGLKLLRQRLGDEQIGYRENGSYELIGENEMHLLDRMDGINRWLEPMLDITPFSIEKEKVAAFGFNAGEVKTLISNHAEGELDMGKMINVLTMMAARAGIRILTGCEVTAIAEDDKGVTAEATTPASSEPVIFSANRMAVCTNAFTPNLLPGIVLQPGRGQVLITEPVENLPFKGIFHFDKGYYYFREIKNRILFGGGRNLDMEGETTDKVALNEYIQRDLEEKLHQLILPGREVTVAARWAGIMAFGDEKYPLIKRYSTRIYLGARLGGMGIAIGSEVGRLLADMMLNE